MHKYFINKVILLQTQRVMIQSKQQLKVKMTDLTTFPKKLKSDSSSYLKFIPYLLTGQKNVRINANQYIFSHLKSIIINQFNSVTLRNTAKFIMTMILIGNLHIYQNIAKFLCPSFQQIIQQEQKFSKRIWNIRKFCIETIMILADWIPKKFLQPNKKSIFVELREKLKIRIEKYTFYNMDKLLYCYQVIKQLGLEDINQDCALCKARGNISCFKNQSALNFQIKMQSGHKQNKDNQNQINKVIHNSLKTPQKYQKHQKTIITPNTLSEQTPKKQVSSFSKKSSKLKNKINQVQHKINKMHMDIYQLQQKKLIQTAILQNL